MDLSSVANAVLLLLVAGVGGILITRRLDRLESRLERFPTREEFEARVGRLEVDVASLSADMSREFGAVRSEMSSEFTAVRSEMSGGFAALRSEMSRESAAVRSEMSAGFAALRSEMSAEFSSIRSDITQIALAIGARLRPQTG